MRSTGVLLSALALALTAGCTSSLGDDAASTQAPEQTASESASSAPATSEPAEEETTAENEAESSASPRESQSASSAKDDAIEASETHGKLLLTSAGEVSDPEDLHGKIVVGQGGCIGFVPIPEGGRPLALVAPDGSKYDGRDHVTIGGETYHFGELVDLAGVAEENSSYSQADRCGEQIVRLAP